MQRWEDNIQMACIVIKYIGFSWLRIMPFLFKFPIETVCMSHVSHACYKRNICKITRCDMSLFIVKNSWNVTLILLVATILSHSVMLPLPRANCFLPVYFHNQANPPLAIKYSALTTSKRIRILHLAKCYWIRKGVHLCFINGNCPLIMRRAVLLTFESHFN